MTPTKGSVRRPDIQRHRELSDITSQELPTFDPEAMFQ
jgi:hypothetical protein